LSNLAKDRPFFLDLAYNAPHTSLQAPKEVIAKYYHIQDKKRRVDAAMIDVMDEGIGEVVAVANGDAQKAPAMEGVNLIPFSTGEISGAPHDSIFWRGGDNTRLSILSSDRNKYLKIGTKEKSKLYQLPEDVSEKNNVITELPELAQKLELQLMAWNQLNVANRLNPFKDYHQQRDEFFLNAFPDEATEEGYKPEKIRTLKQCPQGAAQSWLSHSHQ